MCVYRSADVCIFYTGREHAVRKTRDFGVILSFAEILALTRASRGTWGKLHVIQEPRISPAKGNFKTYITGVRGPRGCKPLCGLFGIV